MPQRYSTYENAKLVSSYDNYPSSWSKGESTIPARRSSQGLSRNHVPATQMFHVTSRAFWNTPAIRFRWRGWVSIYRAGKWRRKSRIVGCRCWRVRFSYSGRKHKQNIHFTCIAYILLYPRTKYLLLNTLNRWRDWYTKIDNRTRTSILAVWYYVYVDYCIVNRRFYK